jgi:ketosteroid isomerase-like protein
MRLPGAAIGLGSGDARESLAPQTMRIRTRTDLMKALTRKSALAALLVASTATAACNQRAAAPASAEPVSEADATAAADATQAAWTSMDVAKIEAPYAKDVVAFDPVDPPLSTTWDNWHKLQQGFAAMKFDKLNVSDRKIQLLDADTFIVSGSGDFTSTDGAMKSATLRFTDVYEKQADGKWLIVNEHASMAPAAPKAMEPAAAPAG